MFRSRSSRSVVATTASVFLILGLMAGTASAADNRVVDFGGQVEGQLDVTPVTAGGAFAISVSATNVGKQNLSHATFGLGTAAALRAGAPSLPAGFEILKVTIAGCPDVSGPSAGYSCDIGALRSGRTVSAQFVVRANSAGTHPIWASFKVAENVNDQGANTNTFFADASLNVGATNSDGNSSYLLGNLRLSTNVDTKVPGDPQVTTVEVPGVTGGLVSIVESNGPTGCPKLCIGQTVRLNIRDGQVFTGSFVKWVLVIATTDAVPSKGGVIHTLDNGNVVAIPNTKANACSASKTLNCFESYTVSKQTGLTTIVFHTPSNGAVRAH